MGIADLKSIWKNRQTASNLMTNLMPKANSLVAAQSMIVQRMLKLFTRTKKEQNLVSLLVPSMEKRKHKNKSSNKPKCDFQSISLFTNFELTTICFDENEFSTNQKYS